MAYPERLLVTGERVSIHARPHWRMLVVPALLPPVVAFAGAWLVAVASSTAGATVALVAVVLAAFGLVGWFSAAPVLRWRATHFVVTDRRILVREGVLTRTGVAVVGRSITSVRTTRTVPERLLGLGTLVVAVDDTREPWRFDGIGRVDRVAAEVERMARRRGGLQPDRWGALDDDTLDDDRDDETHDDDLPDADGGAVVDADWVDDEDGIDADRFPRLRRLSFTRRRALTAAGEPSARR